MRISFEDFMFAFYAADLTLGALSHKLRLKGLLRAFIINDILIQLPEICWETEENHDHK